MLPELMGFYDRYKGQRDRFEIIAFNVADGIDTIAELDRRLKPVVEKTPSEPISSPIQTSV